MNEATKTKHPAYGVAVLTKSHGGKNWLFGSRVAHSELVKVTIYNASECRDLSRDWYLHEDIVCSFSMTAAQWATLVSSFGNGSGVPITFDLKRDGGLVDCPKVPPYIADRKAHEQEADEALVTANEAKDLLLAEFDAYSERPGKKNAAAFRHTLQCRLESILGHLPFILKSYKMKMADVEQDAKTEVEAFVSGAVTRLGLKSLTQLKALPESGPVEGYGIIPEGRRNATLLKLAQTMRDNGKNYDDIEGALYAENDQRCDPPLPLEEVSKIVEEVCNK